MCERQHRYHKRAGRGDYLEAIRRLHGRGLYDADIARVLTHLPRQRLPLLRDLGRDCERLDGLLAEEPQGLAWTPRQVRYYRRGLGLGGYPPPLPRPCLPLEVLEERRELYQCRQGWRCLLPLVLSRREVDVLTRLREAGPQTVPQLCLFLGLPPRSAGWRHRLVSGLARRGLVRRAGLLTLRTRPQCLYALAPAARIATLA